MTLYEILLNLLSQNFMARKLYAEEGTYATREISPSEASKLREYLETVNINISARCNDWRNHIRTYIPDGKLWSELDYQSRLFVFVMSSRDAAAEYWD